MRWVTTIIITIIIMTLSWLITSIFPLWLSFSENENPMLPADPVVINLYCEFVIRSRNEVDRLISLRIGPVWYSP